MTGHRKKPFSGKAKKSQLQARKLRKAAQEEREQERELQREQQRQRNGK